MSSASFGDPIDPNEPIPEPPVLYPAPPVQSPYAPYNPYNPGLYGAPTSPYYDPNGYSAYGGYYAPPPGRPGAALAASILAMIDAGFLLVSGFIVIFAASTIATQTDSGFVVSSGRVNDLVLAGLGNVIAASLLLIGAVMMLGRSRGARVGVVLGALLTLALGVFWFNEQPDGGGRVFWVFVFCGPALVAGLLTLSAQVTAWLNSAP